MEYPFIKSLVPDGDQFDSKALNEGVWLSQGHLDAIEKKGSGFSADAVKLENDLAIAQQDIDAKNKKISELETKASDSSKDVTTKDKRIKELEDQVVKLGGESSGTGSTVITKKDEKNEEVKEKPSYESDSNPANAWADKRINSAKNTKVTKNNDV